MLRHVRRAAGSLAAHPARIILQETARKPKPANLNCWPTVTENQIFAPRLLVGRVHDSIFRTSSAKKLTLNQTPVITVTGKAFFDVGHSLKDQKSNRRSHLPSYAAWEIHPVMKFEGRFDVQR
jgi:hypothetical protein